MIKSRIPNDTNTIVFAMVLRSEISYKKSFISVIPNSIIAPTRKCFLFFQMPKTISNNANQELNNSVINAAASRP
jgi:hypothetical protein